MRTDPSPSLVTTGTVHLGNGGSQKTTEGSGKRSSREEESSTETKFLALVPAADAELALIALQRHGQLTKGSS